LLVAVDHSDLILWDQFPWMGPLESSKFILEEGRGGGGESIGSSE